MSPSTTIGSSSRVEGAVAHRHVDVALRVVPAAELLIRPGREEHVPVEAPAVHVQAAAVGGQVRPRRLLVQAPADVGDPVGLLVVERRHVVADDVGVELAADVDDAPLLDRELDRRAHVLLERVDDVARREHDLAVDSVVGAAGEEEPRRPVIPAARRVGEAVLGDHRIRPELVGHVGAECVREAKGLRLCQQLAAELDPLALIGRREELDEVLDRLHAEEDARPRVLDLELLLREQQEDGVDHEVGGLERLERRPVRRKRRRPDRPLARVAGKRGGGVRHPDVERGRTEPARCGQEGIGVVELLAALRQDRDHLAFLDSAEPELLLAEVDERAGADAEHPEPPQGVGKVRYTIFESQRRR